MTELILGGIIIGLLGVLSWIIRENNHERSKLINAILAKDSQEYVNRTLADGTQIKPDIEPAIKSDLTPIDQLSDEDFDEHIKSQLEELS